MMRHLIHVTGVIITFTLLLAVIVATSHTRQARLAESQPAFTLGSDDKEEKDTAIVCLALIGGIALLAGSVWMKKLR